RALSLLDDGLFRPTVAEARLVYKTMGLKRSYPDKSLMWSNFQRLFRILDIKDVWCNQTPFIFRN
ncbi:hypothetical protein, partial [Burkholderia ubonensis]|uniref:hypothetical protein n=1 Tax=Burkholderia ubonensis TaxID=101571 RepID=UPI001E497FCF